MSAFTGTPALSSLSPDHTSHTSTIRKTSKIKLMDKEKGCSNLSLQRLFIRHISHGAPNSLVPALFRTPSSQLPTLVLRFKTSKQFEQHMSDLWHICVQNLSRRFFRKTTFKYSTQISCYRTHITTNNKSEKITIFCKNVGLYLKSIWCCAKALIVRLSSFPICTYISLTSPSVACPTLQSRKTSWRRWVDINRFLTVLGTWSGF